MLFLEVTFTIIVKTSKMNQGAGQISMIMSF